MAKLKKAPPLGVLFYGVPSAASIQAFAFSKSRKAAFLGRKAESPSPQKVFKTFWGPLFRANARSHRVKIKKAPQFGVLFYGVPSAIRTRGLSLRRYQG